MPKSERKKAKPMTVRFPHELQDWVNAEALKYKEGKTGLIVEAVERLREFKESNA